MSKQIMCTYQPKVMVINVKPCILRIRQLIVLMINKNHCEVLDHPKCVQWGYSHGSDLAS